MATVVQATIVAPDSIAQFYLTQARDPNILPRTLGRANVRYLATTTDNAAGVFANLSTVVVSPTQTGFDFLTPGQNRVIRVKIYGKSTTGNGNLYYADLTFLVVCAATPVAAQAAAATANVIDIGTTTNAVTCVVTSQQVTLLLAGKAATTLNWILDVSVDDPIPLAA